MENILGMRTLGQLAYFICRLLEQGPRRICFVLRRGRGNAVDSGVFANNPYIPNEIDVLELNMIS